MKFPFARLFTFVALVSALCSNATAGTLPDAAGAKAFTDRVMVKVGAGDMAGGVELARPYLIVPLAEFDVMLNQLKLQQPAMTQRFGKSIGAEFIRQEQVGANLLRIVQIHRFEKHAMRWSFYFYRGSAGWVLNTFQTDDDITQLFSK